MCKVNKKMRKLHREFVKENGCEPTYVDVVVNWQDWDEPSVETLKLKDFDIENTENDPDDEQITFYVNGIDELCDLANGNGEDFTITDVERFFNEL